jgi:ABC-2 type transport system permease protein
MYYLFNIVFKMKLSTGQAFLPYLLSGVLTMTFFNQALTMSADAVATGSGVLTKVYVRPEIFAFSATISSAVNFVLGLIPLTIVLLIFGHHPGLKAPLVLIYIFCMTLFTTGLGLLLSIAYVRFDDTRSLIQIFLMALGYLTPVFYPITALGPHTQIVIHLNPLTSYLQVLRDIFGSNANASQIEWLTMLGSSFLVFLMGMFVFGRAWPRMVAKL